jgi:hypothetical protein
VGTAAGSAGGGADGPGAVRDGRRCGVLRGHPRLGLAVRAPGGPPADSAGFLARLDAGWLAAAYAGSAELADEVRAAAQNAWVADPDRVRNFRAGQATWIHGNACTYVTVAPWRRPPRALTAGPPLLEPAPSGAPGPGGPGTPDGLGQPGPAVPLPGGMS